MALRFRRSIKIAPGLKVNLGKRGVSLSAGVRGASVTVGSRGTYGNIGIPGTGLSYRTRIDSGGERRRIEKEQRRIEREYERQEKERRHKETLSNIKLTLNKENGTVKIENAFGKPLSKSDMALIWNQKRDTILEWLEQQADEINGDVDLLTQIHEDTPSPDSIPEYQTINFSEEPPTLPSFPEKNAKPKLPTLQPIGFMAKLFKNKRIAFEEKNVKFTRSIG